MFKNVNSHNWIIFATKTYVQRMYATFVAFLNIFQLVLHNKARIVILDFRNTDRRYYYGLVVLMKKNLN